MANSSFGTLIVVSNRLPFVLKYDEETGNFERKSSAGGLVTAVSPIVVQSQGLWIGHPGVFLEDYPGKESIKIPEADPASKSPELKPEQVIPVNIEKESYDLYYNKCCNAALWPLFHSMCDRAVFCGESWDAYVHVNTIFAEKTLEALRKVSVGDTDSPVPLIWIHDYHLLLAANIIRQMVDEEQIRCKIGFFLHIPFPAYDLFRLLPNDDVVLQGLLGCDMVGFHIEDYAVNFLDCCRRRVGLRIDRKAMLVEFGGRTVRVRYLPIGIPFDRFVKLAKEAPRVWPNDPEQKIILGVDRLDYTKGLVHRLRSFERLLEKRPEYIEKVCLLQIAVPSRTDVKEYQDLKEEVDQVVGQINGRFSTFSWSPIRYIYGFVGQDELSAFYKEASVALVTPLRDGMNLVAKEFVACQIDKAGVLILSPFAGAGETMQEALIVNPYELDEVAETLHRALTMPQDEREVRMSHLRKRERLNDVNCWMKSFLKAMGSLLNEDGEDMLPTTMMPLNLDDFEEYLAKYVGNVKKLALLLDYDGTLAPIASHPNLATIPHETKKVLERLSNIPDVFIAIVSGRSVENVKEMVGIENITYAGNHGLEICHPDGTKFIHPMPAEYEDNLRNLLKDLQEQACHEGAWVENKGAVLSFHYRDTPVHIRTSIIKKAQALMIKNGFIVGKGHCVVEAKPPVEWDKGRASIYILRTAFGVDWNERVRIIYAGDDVTDEDAMRSLKGMAATFRVTPSHTVRTAADRRLPNTDSILTMLKWVDRHFSNRAPGSNYINKKHHHKSMDCMGIQSEVHFPENRMNGNGFSHHTPVLYHHTNSNNLDHDLHAI